MKTYKQWEENNCEENCDIGSDEMPCNRCNGLGTKEDTWKAALKEVLTLVEPVGDQYGFPGQLMISNASIDIIKKELEDESI